MAMVRFVRIILQTIGAITLLVAICLTSAGLFTPSWQVAEIHQPHQYHLRGLWEDCVAAAGENQWTRVLIIGERTVRNSDWICVYKHFEHSYDYQGTSSWNTNQNNWNANNNWNTNNNWNSGWNSGNNINQFENTMAYRENWKLHVLILISLAAVLGLLSLLLTCCAGLHKCCAVASTTMIFITTLLSIVGVVLFIRNANDPRNKFVLAATETTEQKLGSSFYLAVGGCITFILSLVISALTTTLVFCSDRYGDDDSGQSSPSFGITKRIQNMQFMGRPAPTVIHSHHVEPYSTDSMQKQSKNTVI